MSHTKIDRVFVLLIEDSISAEMPHESLQDINDFTGWQQKTLNLPSADLARRNRESEQKINDFSSWQQRHSLDPGAEHARINHYPVREIYDLPGWQKRYSLDIESDQTSTNHYPELENNDNPGWQLSDSLNLEGDHARIGRSPLQDVNDFLGLHSSGSLEVAGTRSSSAIPRVAREFLKGIRGVAGWKPIDCKGLKEADHARMKEQYNAILSNLSSRSYREAGAMNRAVGVTQDVEDDITFPENSEREREYVRIMYDAILDMQHCEDNEGMQKSWRRVMKDEVKMERLAWEMMVSFY